MSDEHEPTPSGLFGRVPHRPEAPMSAPPLSLARPVSHDDEHGHDGHDEDHDTDAPHGKKSKSGLKSLLFGHLDAIAVAGTAMWLNQNAGTVESAQNMAVYTAASLAGEYVGERLATKKALPQFLSQVGTEALAVLVAKTGLDALRSGQPMDVNVLLAGSLTKVDELLGMVLKKSDDLRDSMRLSYVRVLTTLGVLGFSAKIASESYARGDYASSVLLMTAALTNTAEAFNQLPSAEEMMAREMRVKIEKSYNAAHSTYFNEMSIRVRDFKAKQRQRSIAKAQEKAHTAISAETRRAHETYVREVTAQYDFWRELYEKVFDDDEPAITVEEIKDAVQEMAESDLGEEKMYRPAKTKLTTTAETYGEHIREMWDSARTHAKFLSLIGHILRGEIGNEHKPYNTFLRESSWESLGHDEHQEDHEPRLLGHGSALGHRLSAGPVGRGLHAADAEEGNEGHSGTETPGPTGASDLLARIRAAHGASAPEEPETLPSMAVVPAEPEKTAVVPATPPDTEQDHDQLPPVSVHKTNASPMRVGPGPLAAIELPEESEVTGTNGNHPKEATVEKTPGTSAAEPTVKVTEVDVPEGAVIVEGETVVIPHRVDPRLVDVAKVFGELTHGDRRTLERFIARAPEGIRAEVEKNTAAELASGKSVQEVTIRLAQQYEKTRDQKS